MRLLNNLSFVMRFGLDVPLFPEINQGPQSLIRRLPGYSADGRHTRQGHPLATHIAHNEWENIT